MWCSLNHQYQYLKSETLIFMTQVFLRYLFLSLFNSQMTSLSPGKRNNIQDSFPWCTGANKTKHGRRYSQLSFRQRSGWAKHTLCRLSNKQNKHTRIRRKPPNIYCDLLSHHPHLHTKPRLLTWTCPPCDHPIPSCSSSSSSSSSPPLPPNTSPVGGVMSGFCGGLLTTGPDNQRVCKCQCVIFKSLFMVRVLKEDIFMVIVAGLFYYIFM